MSSPEINSVLAQMRVLAQDIQKPDMSALQAQSAQTRPASDGTGFGEAMQDAIKDVNAEAMKAGELVKQFETGQGDASVAEVMVQMQKASVSMQAMTEVRNRLVEAYREIMSMPL
ncbi:MAG: flagellar hook-basal body complex protein FliE [Gammaproteobacteria bacterium]|nr:flagellar hook-basal body complex protein FliE [Gammaproteobacteria bacterium]